jgi:hypothetical protein
MCACQRLYAPDYFPSVGVCNIREGIDYKGWKHKEIDKEVSFDASFVGAVDEALYAF